MGKKISKVKSIQSLVTGVEKAKPIYINGERSDYLISPYGYVISHNRKKKPVILKNHVTENGYNVVCLYHNDKKYWRYIHRLVASTFIEIPEKYRKMGLTENDLEVNHKIGTFSGKSMNTVDNLEWATSSDNKIHAYKENLMRKGEDSAVSKYTNEQIEMVCKLLEENKLGNREIWKKTAVSVTTIQTILAKKQWTHISKKYDFSNHKKRHILYPPEVKLEAIEMLKNSDLSFKDIGDILGMTRNAVWFINEQHKIRDK